MWALPARTTGPGQWNVSTYDETSDKGMPTQQSAKSARGLVRRIVVTDLSINSLHAKRDQRPREPPLGLVSLLSAS